MTEIWKAVPGHEGAYEVSDQGRVRSLDRPLTQAGRNGTIYTKLVRGRLLRPGRSSGGHLTVALGRGDSRLVHHLVLAAFVGPRPSDKETRHLDGEHTNNRLANVEYSTRSRNTQDKKWHAGTTATKLRPPQIARIKAALRRGVVGAGLARAYGVSQSTISSIKHDQVHRDV